MCDMPLCKRPGKAIYHRRGERACGHLCDYHAQKFGYCIGCGCREFPPGEGVNEAGYCLACEMGLDVKNDYEQLEMFDNAY